MECNGPNSWASLVSWAPNSNKIAHVNLLGYQGLRLNPFYQTSIHAACDIKVVSNLCCVSYLCQSIACNFMCLLINRFHLHLLRQLLQSLLLYVGCDWPPSSTLKCKANTILKTCYTCTNNDVAKKMAYYDQTQI